jgi:hypothetical protein
MDFPIRFLLISVAALAVMTARLTVLSRPLVRYLRLDRRFPALDINDAAELTLSGIVQAVFCGILIAAIPIETGSFLPSKFPPILALYGVVLGVGEMAVVSLFGYIGMQVAGEVAPSRGAKEQKQWLLIARGGWMRQCIKTMEILPLPIALLIIGLSIGVEETLYRGILINYFGPAGAAFALVASGFLFTAVQAFHMPGWRTAMFPMIGAIVVSIVHGGLFLAVPDVRPLIIAHFTFFISAII